MFNLLGKQKNPVEDAAVLKTNMFKWNQQFVQEMHIL